MKTARNSRVTNGVKDCVEWTIYMDGLGGVIGYILGPFGSIATSTALSIGAKKECECDGKYK